MHNFKVWFFEPVLEEDSVFSLHSVPLHFDICHKRYIEEEKTLVKCTVFATTLLDIFIIWSCQYKIIKLNDISHGRSSQQILWLFNANSTYTISQVPQDIEMFLRLTFHHSNKTQWYYWQWQWGFIWKSIRGENKEITLGSEQTKSMRLKPSGRYFYGESRE